MSIGKAACYTGLTTVNSGTLTLGIAGAINTSSGLTVNGGTVGVSTFAQALPAVVLKGGSITGTTGALTSTAAYDVQSGSITALLAGTAGMVKSTPGTVTLGDTTANTFTGGVTIKAGTLVTNTGNVVSIPSANAVTLGDTSGNFDARWQLGGSVATYANNIVLNGGTAGQLSIGNQNSSTSLTVSGTVTGNNNLTLSNVNGVGITFSGSVNPAGKIFNAGAGSGPNVISGAIGTNVLGIVQNSTASTLTLSGANTYTSGTTVTLGTLKVGSATGLGASGGPVAIASGAALDVNFAMTNTNPLSVLGTGTAGGGALINSSTTAGVYAGAVTLGGNTTFGTTSTAALTVSGAVGGPFNLTLNGSSSGAVVLSGPNTYSGATTVTAGVGQFGKAAALYGGAPANWTTTNLVVNSGATLAFNVGGTGEFTASDFATLATVASAAGGFKSGSSIGLDTASGNVAYGSVIANPNGGANVLGLNKLGANTLTLTAANTYTGATTLRPAR